MENNYNEYFEFLDDLRDSGEVNMFGARPILADAFNLDKKESGEILKAWMDTFKERHSQ